MWRTPTRPRENDITQSYGDGVLTVYAAADTAKPGYAPVVKLTRKATLRYAERRLGIQRYYDALQNQIQVERVLRVPRAGNVTSQDVAITEDGRQYRIDLVQSVDEVYPPSVDLTLSKVEQEFKAENFAEDEP